MEASRSQTWFFVALLAITLFLTWSIFAPYISALILAGTLSFLFLPIDERLRSIFRYRWAAALGTVMIAALIVFVPIGFLGVRIFGEATALYASLTSHGSFDLGAALTNFLQTHFKDLRIA